MKKNDTLQPPVAPGVQLSMRTPLLTQRNLLAALLVAALALGCAAAILLPAPSPFELSLVSVAAARDTSALASLGFASPIDNTNDDCVLLVRLLNPSRRELWFATEAVRARVNGLWLSPAAYSLDFRCLIAAVPPRSQELFPLALVPRSADAILLSVQYAPEPALYRAHCRALRYLHDSPNNHKFRSALVYCLDRWAIAPLADLAWSRLKWRSRTFELILPKPPAQPMAPAEMFVQRQGRSPRTNESDFYLLNGTRRIVR